MVQIGSYYSQALGREQPFAYLLPPGYDPTTTKRYPLLVMLHGLNGNSLDWTTHTRIERYVAEEELVVAFPDGGNGWYTNAFDGSGRYEDDLLQDFLPHLQATFPLLIPGKDWCIGGLSMGGYGAIKLALKHPHLFLRAFSHSGAFEATRKETHPVFGDPQTHASFRRAENPFALAELALCRLPTERPRLSLDCGLQDELVLETNRRFHQHLNFIGYLHTYQETRGYHSWPYWDRAFRAAIQGVAWY